MGEKVVVRPASPRDAPEIYRMKREAFGADYVTYTIFQSPKSVRYLKWLISRGPGPTGTHIYVLEADSLVAGYYSAVLRNRTWLLTYIAVGRELRGRGFGGVLLDDFERKAVGLSADQLGIDVFETNARALNWYESRGYMLKGRTRIHRVRITGMRDPQSLRIRISPLDRIGASYREFAWGFSKTYGTIGPGRIEIGFINQDTVNLISVNGLDQDAAVSSVIREFSGNRSTLLLRCPDYRLGPPLLSSVTLQRLSKPNLSREAR
jgi:ribosomal protein S18 acetylase RimI-like enzyme